MMVLAPAAMVGLAFLPLVQASSRQHPPHFCPVPLEMGSGCLLWVLGLCRSMWGLLVQAALRVGIFVGRGTRKSAAQANYTVT